MQKIKLKTVTFITVIFIVTFILGAFYLLKPSYQLSIPIEALSCEKDTDCALFQPDCGDCKFDAVNKNQLAKMYAQKGLECLKNPPKTMCDAIFTGQLKCIEKKCTIIP